MREKAEKSLLRLLPPTIKKQLKRGFYFLFYNRDLWLKKFNSFNVVKRFFVA